MKRIAWLTDIHLEFLARGETFNFIDQVEATNPDLVLIGGDTGTAKNLDFFFGAFED